MNGGKLYFPRSLCFNAICFLSLEGDISWTVNGVAFDSIFVGRYTG